MYIRIQIQETSQGGGLNIEESYPLESNDFLSIAKILGQFHDLATAIKSQESE
jgi:hypothetical protein